MSRVFFDTNILVYAFASGDHRTPRSLELLHKGGAISIQCLNEFASVGRKKQQRPWPELFDAFETIRGLCDPVVTIDTGVHSAGLRLAERYQLSIYDAMIVAAALQAGCDTLYSEDMQHALQIEGRLTLVNPFAA